MTGATNEKGSRIARKRTVVYVRAVQPKIGVRICRREFDFEDSALSEILSVFGRWHGESISIVCGSSQEEKTEDDG